MKEGIVLAYAAIAVIFGLYHLWGSHHNAGIHDEPSAEMSAFMGAFWLPVVVGLAAVFVYIRVSERK